MFPPSNKKEKNKKQKNQAHILIPRNCEQVMFCEERKLKLHRIEIANQLILRWGDYPELSGWT